eukprot:c12866_g1_i1.p1 GENE.c12866_g1_i1~~c12866_g1_i1.p1  ORF type:complete len:1032 (+),score=269.35 c12866_g1_i1:412-3096(+)
MRDAISAEKLETIVNRMFERSYVTQRHKQALGIALESRRLDMVRRFATARESHIEDMIAYCFDRCLNQIRTRAFRCQVLEVLVELHGATSPVNHTRLARCHMLLDKAEAVAELLISLIGDDASNQENTLTAFQVSFDLVDNASQAFLLRVLATLPSPHLPSAAPPVRDEAQQPEQQTTTQQTGQDSMVVDSPPTLTAATPAATTTTTPAAAATELSHVQRTYQKLHTILSGHVTVRHRIDFLHRLCHSDMQILKNTKTVVEARSSALYTGLVACNAIMHAGTTNDSFLRANLDWLRQAQNWAKFSAIGSLGLIRLGQVQDGMTLLKDFLPGQGTAGGAYQEGGALYALGLINAERGKDVVEYLLTSLRAAAQSEVIQHGACLGLGLAAFATGNEQLYEEMKGVLYLDNTVAGEAAAFGMGLVMCGTGNATAIDEMIHYARETQKEKVIRALSVGVALVMYGREELADTLIQQMMLDKDHLVRYGAMFVIAMAYASTADNGAIRKLLHVAVSDVSDDVRRAAVIALGFVLANEHHECPKVVSLLSQSYNPHVRYGAALAVGISCAGTGLKAAVDLLLPMSKDSTDYVRQAANIALSLVLIQATEAQDKNVKEFREALQKSVQDKHEETLAKLGSILSLGIIDVGGRNATIGLHSDSGFPKMGAVVGMAMFVQFWYWFPLTSFIGLAMKPTGIIALTADLETPNMSFVSHAKASEFAYPPDVKAAQSKVTKKTNKAVLSTTNKQAAKGKRGGKDQEGDVTMGDGEAKPNQTTTAANTNTAANTPAAATTTTGEKSGEQKDETTPAEKQADVVEPATQTLQNPARVTTAQQQHIEFILEQRYQPVTTAHKNGIIVVRDTRPETAPDLVSSSIQPTLAVPATEDSEVEPEPPAPFQWP